MDFLSACRDFIGLESTPSHGNLDVAVRAKELSGSHGLDVQLLEETHAGLPQANVIVRPKNLMGSGEAELMLQSHLDTVDPGPYGLWVRNGANPFNATIYQDSIYGLGAADAKLDFLCKLRALSDLKESKFRRPVVLVGTYGEELGMSGATKLIRRKAVRPRWALVGEATDLRLVHAAKGIAGVEISIPFSEEEKRYKSDHNLQESTSSQSKIFSGRPAHSSNPVEGDNAINKMLRHLSHLPTGIAVMQLDGGVNFNTVPSHAVFEIDLVGTLKNTVVDKIKSVLSVLDQLELEFANFKDEGFAPGEPTLTIGMVRTYEDEIVLSGNCRWPPLVSDQHYMSWMERLRVACEELGGRFRLFEVKHPFETPTASDFSRTCQDALSSMTLNPMAIKHSTCSEANLFSRLKIECLNFGPGRVEGNLHTPLEHVRLDDLEKAVDFYKRVITRMCL